MGTVEERNLEPGDDVNIQRYSYDSAIEVVHRIMEKGGVKRRGQTIWSDDPKTLYMSHILEHG